MELRPRVLMIAYACEPHRGSEPEVGWNFALAASRVADVHVVTRANNRHVIEAELSGTAVDGLEFSYVDLPGWARFFKKKARGAYAYSFFWQVAAVAEGLRLHRRRPFDLVHHVTFVQRFLPTLAATLPVPLVWGPIGGNQPMPAAFASYLLDRRERLENLVRAAVPWATLAHLPLQAAMWRARVLIVLNHELLAALPGAQRPKAVVSPANYVQVPQDADPRRSAGEFTALMAGNFIGMKGFRLGIEAFQRFWHTVGRGEGPRPTLVVCGQGRHRAEYEHLVEDLGLQDCVTFTGMVPRAGVHALMRRSHVLVHPSFEAGGQVVQEALSLGTPVVCLDVGGPGEYVTKECGVKVPVTSPGDAVERIAEALLSLYSKPRLREEMGRAGISRMREHYSLERLAQMLRMTYAKALAQTQ